MISEMWPIWRWTSEKHDIAFVSENTVSAGICRHEVILWIRVSTLNVNVTYTKAHMWEFVHGQTYTHTHTHPYTSLSWHPTPSIILLEGFPDSDRVVFGAKTLSFCSLTFDRVSIPPDWFPLLCLHLHLFPVSFLSSLFVEALTQMRQEPFKMSGDASWCFSSALGINLSGQFVPRVSRTLMRASTVKFCSLNLARKRFCLTICALRDGNHLCLTFVLECNRLKY